ncbi:hypothetical protein [Streptomyces katsurahamanus]|uniref:Uncharacterized protein n=1 Tax=Streptomyces katsurahamanus TaxID=2577098 RepID=A0ABW9NSB5_9ACTN|nr:hypothetical protein [Streptomyces katsurahamanus]MQS36202.1 hypothetical protein [Streptomyces katsurahamanus]
MEHPAPPVRTQQGNLLKAWQADATPLTDVPVEQLAQASDPEVNTASNRPAITGGAAGVPLLTMRFRMC